MLALLQTLIMMFKLIDLVPMIRKIDSQLFQSRQEILWHERLFLLLPGLAFVVWYLTGLFLDVIDEIGIDQAAALRDDSVPNQTDDVPPHQRIVNLVFTLGIVLVI